MPRERRIEYDDAIYHVMARGDRREDIVLDDADRDHFEETLEEVIEKSGWVLFGWVLMNSHYHFLFKTPEANLVEGMSWFQGTWTKRFNARHKLWGHLFGGRYKAIPVEDGEYLTRLIHYVHLNPVRAGLVKMEDGIESYRWCSLGDYIKPKRSRRKWVAIAQGLVAGLIRERALVPNAWIADRLAMGATGAVSRTIREARAFAARDRKARPLARELSKNV